MAAKKKIDYARIEPGWRAGLKSVSQLAEEYTAETGTKVSHAAIIKHFKKLGVPRDLSEKIKSKVNSMVTESMVTGMVRAETKSNEKEIIDGAATEVATVLFSHRKDIGRFRGLVTKLLGEIESETDNPVLFEELADLIIWKINEPEGGVQTKDEIKRKQQLQTLFDRVMSNPARVDSLKKLADAFKTLVGLERQSLGLPDDPPKGDDPDDDKRVKLVLVPPKRVYEDETA